VPFYFRVCLTLFICFVNISKGQVIDDQYSLNLRFAALIAQQRLASPPLPSLKVNQESKLGLQSSYIKGSIEAMYYFEASDGAMVPVRGYSGNSEAYSGALSYTSPSIARFSFFAFGIHTRGTSYIEIPWISATFQNNQNSATSMSIGANRVFLGNNDSFMRIGYFAGAFLSQASAQYDYVLTEGTVPPGSPPLFGVQSQFTKHGGLAGIQAEMSVSRLSLKSHLMYAHDFTQPCVDIKIYNTVFPCYLDVDSTFVSVGASVGLWGFSFSLYSQIWNKIENFDIRFKKYQLSYTLSL